MIVLTLQTWFRLNLQIAAHIAYHSSINDVSLRSPWRITRQYISWNVFFLSLKSHFPVANDRENRKLSLFHSFEAYAWYHIRKDLLFISTAMCGIIDKFDCHCIVTTSFYFVCLSLLGKKGQLCVVQRKQLQHDNGGYIHCKVWVISHILGCNLGWFGVFWAGLEFFGLVLGLFYEGIGLVFQPAPGNTGKEHVTRLD